jgi:alpha-galactosidase
MTRNTKIALGCGGGGCLGLIFLVILFAVLIVAGVIKAPGLYNPDRRSSNYNYKYNRNSNYNSNLNQNSNSNTSSSTSTMSDDAKHRLVLAASLAEDSDLMKKVMLKLGFVTDSGVSDDYADFIREHAVWAIRNREFIKSVNTPESARAYVNEHLDD